MEKTKIKNNMSVNFKDFAAKTRFVVAICSGICVTFNSLFNGLINTADLLHSFLLSQME